MCQRILRLLSLMLGLLGLVGCVAAVFAIWIVSSKVNRATENAFSALDDTLITVQQRVSQSQDRVQALKVTAEGIEESVKTWTKAEARERVGSRLAVKEKAERLASGLQQADHWLELTESSVQLVQQGLEVGGALGMPIQADRADRLLDEVVSLRAELKQAIEPVEGIRERATEGDEENPRADRFNRMIQLTVRVLATLSAVDSQLETLEGQLAEIQTKTRIAKGQAMWWIRVTAIGITLLLTWVAAGQGALCNFGWKGLRRQDSVSTCE